MTTGFLHPGAMGAAVGAACKGERLWASQGRSDATAKRATDAGLVDVAGLAALCDQADMIVCICPPDAALAQARGVQELGFKGTYVDANAISPATSRAINELFDDYVDGGIVGLPPQTTGTTRLYVSGPSAAQVAHRWEGSVLEVRQVEGGAGAASAIKVCFAAWTKGTGALLLAVRALAESEGITPALLSEWETSMPQLIARADATAAGVGPKAWRFAGEMQEIAATFAAAELPDGFHLAAADIYDRLAGLKDQTPPPTLSQVLERIGNQTAESGV